MGVNQEICVLPLVVFAAIIIVMWMQLGTGEMHAKCTQKSGLYSKYGIKGRSEPF